MSFTTQDIEFYGMVKKECETIKVKRVLEEIEGIRTLLPLQERILKVWILAILDDLVRKIK